MLSFLFVTDQLPGADGGKRKLLVRWYRDWPELRAGEHWQLHLQLKPARSRVNFNGPDRERWYFSRGVAALGIVIPGTGQRLPRNQKVYPAWRQAVRDELLRVLDRHSAAPVLMALALADRSAISKRQWSAFRTTGTSHLLAISGMHIGLASMIGFWSGRAFTTILPTRMALRSGPLLYWVFSVLLAGTYSALAGFGTSTRRALIMLLVICLVHLCRRHTGAAQGLLIALLAVLIIDPLAPLDAGFWFSFTAVAALLAMLAAWNGVRGRLQAMARIQAGLMLVMLPMSMLWFQQVTALGIVSNLVAIPWVSFLVVPPVLLSLVLMPFNFAVSPFLLFLAAESLARLLQVIEWFAGIGEFGWFTTHKPDLWLAALATAGGFILLLPRGIPARFIGVTLMAPLFIPARPDSGLLHLEMLDVGQGLAVIVSTTRHILLYDSGPGDGTSWDLVNTTIMPSVSDSGRRAPDLVMISHADLDHAGGLSSVRDKYPDTPILANLRKPQPESKPCLAPASWVWDGVYFQVLHPGPGLPYLGNDSSCVLSIRSGEQSVLLTGDISYRVEQRLVLQGLQPHGVLFAPHHGSKSSSSAQFIDAVDPRISLVSAGYRNRFGFPHTSVSQKFEQHGSPVLNTADCGAIRIETGPAGEIHVTTARRARDAIWRWHAAPYCP
jgi:competence protein ComEC